LCSGDHHEIRTLALSIECALNAGIINAPLTGLSSMASRHWPAGASHGGFGSWYFRFNDQVVPYDGRESWLIAQPADGEDFKDIRIIRLHASQDRLKGEDCTWHLRRLSMRSISGYDPMSSSHFRSSQYGAAEMPM
jgi:hypothetical protein